MARQRRGAATPARSAPARPTPAPTRPAGYTSSHQQQRPSSTAAAPAPTAAAPPAAAPAAAPPAQAAAPVQQSQGPGLFAQMASTAAGVAVGSSIGHAVGSLFTGGGSSSAPAEAQQAPAAPAAQPMDNGLYQSQSWGETPACENDVRAFRKCMDENSGNMSICGWYLDQLKACQQAAKQY